MGNKRLERWEKDGIESGWVMNTQAQSGRRDDYGVFSAVQEVLQGPDTSKGEILAIWCGPTTLSAGVEILHCILREMCIYRCRI